MSELRWLAGEREVSDDPSLSVQLLADRPDVLEELEEWFIREWEPYYGPQGPGDAGKDLAECCQRTGIPVALVAFEPITATIPLSDINNNDHPSLGDRETIHAYSQEGEYLVADVGPSTNEDGVRASWFALEHGVGLTETAVASLIEGFAPEDALPRLEEQIKAVAQRRGELRREAIARWGDEDPFEGQW